MFPGREEGLASGVASEAGRRAQTLGRLQLLEGMPPEALRRLTRLAAYVAGGEATTVGAAIHLLDDQGQYRIAASSGPVEVLPVEPSLCARALALDRPLFSADASSDERLSGAVLRMREEPVRFFVAIPLRLQDGTAIGTLCLFDTSEQVLTEVQRDLLLDVAAQAASQLDLLGVTRELGHDATHDPLTGVANRVLLSHRLGLALSRRVRPPAGPLLLLLDLDGFKAVNDRHGHVVGDEVLASTARRVKALLRPEDLLARIGGDEFAILIDSGLDDGALAGLAARLARAGAQPHDTTAGPVSCSFSFGVARSGPEDLSYELLARADTDLYARKAPPGPRT